ncbi:MAG: hypothetical protein FWD44_00030 [Oscillospiraceae bacterium]|nr:hypothetical protein [Oscillospiraceae bacterium]
MINVLVTSVGNIGVGSQILKALQISNLPLLIIGLDVSLYNIPQNRLNHFYSVPFASEVLAYEEAIDEIISKHKIHIIFIGSAMELLFFAKRKEKYYSLGIFLAINDSKLILMCRNKYDIYRNLEKKGIEVPKYCLIKAKEDCEKISFFPVVLKPNRNTSSSEHIYIAFDADDVCSFSSYMIKHNIEVIAQEYIGDSNSEYTTGISSNLSGDINGSIIIKRVFDSAISYKNKISYENKTYFISSGITQGEIIHDEVIKRQIEKIAMSLNSKGPLNIQGMFFNNNFSVIEVHPSMTSSVYIKALAGYNEPENIIRQNLMNENVNYNYRDIKIARDLVEYVI